MKTVEELLKEIGESEALKTEFEAAADQDKVAEFFKQHDCEATLEEIVDFVKANEKEDAELSDKELDSVAGGGWFTPRKKKCVTIFKKKICV